MHASSRSIRLSNRMKRGLIIALGMSTALPVWAVEIDDSTTTPVQTSTANAGQADDVTVTEDGDILSLIHI